MAGAVVIAIVTFGANGFGGSGRNAMAAPRIQESAEEPEEPEEEVVSGGSSFVTEAKITIWDFLNYRQRGPAAGRRAAGTGCPGETKKRGSGSDRDRGTAETDFEREGRRGSQKKGRRRAAGRQTDPGFERGLSDFAAHRTGGSRYLRR